MNRLILISILMAIFVQTANCLEFNEYMQLVFSSNKSYLAEKHNIGIAEANIEAASIANDPELSFNYGNNQDWNLRMGQTFEVGMSYSIPLGGARGLRIKLAKGTHQIATAELADYLSNLKVAAAEAFATAWMMKKERQLAENNYNIMRRIAQSDSLRLSLGDINMADAMQSDLEARTAYGKLIKADAEYRNALLTLSTYIGGAVIDSIGDLSTNDFLPPSDNLDQLKIMALEYREDLHADSLRKKATEQNLKLVKADRVPELTLNASYVHSNEVINELAPAPKYDGFSVGFSIPLPFASANHGALKAAKLEMLKSGYQYQASTERVYAEVEQAYNQYKAAEAAVQEYDNQLLNNAQTILNAKVKGYDEGEWSLADLLIARETYFEVMRGYYEASAEKFMASVLLNRAIGK